MITSSFTPAIIQQYTDSSDRQLDFTQSPSGNVFVRVHYGLSEINTVSQRNIFVAPNFVGFQQHPTSLENLTPVQRKAVIEAIGNKTAEIELENGAQTDIKKRNTVGDVFFHRIASMTVSMK